MLKFLALVAALAAQVAQAPKAPPKLFTADADAREKIAAAIEMAATDGIRVLVVWGSDDHALSLSYGDARKTPEVARATFFSDEYKLVQVDVGHADKNVDLAKSYGATLTSASVPAFTVLDDHGRPVAQTTGPELLSAAGRTIDGSKLASFLKANQAPAPDDVARFDAGLKKAKATGKYVFLWWSAPW